MEMGSKETLKNKIMNTTEINSILENLFKSYSNYTSLAEGHYDYLMDADDFKEAVTEFIKQYNSAKKDENNNNN